MTNLLNLREKIYTLFVDFLLVSFIILTKKNTSEEINLITTI